MTSLTFFRSRNVPISPLILPGEMLAYKRARDRVAIDFSNAAHRGVWPHVEFGPNVTLLYTEERRIGVIPIGLRLCREALTHPKLKGVLRDIFGDETTAQGILQISTTGPNMLRIEPGDYFGKSGIHQRLGASLSRQLGKRLSSNLTKNALEWWREHFKQLEKALQQAKPPKKRDERMEVLAGCKKAFNTAWRVEL